MINRLLSALTPSTRDEEMPFEDLSKEEQQRILSEEKSQRTEWHRRNVRNGPARFTAISEGRATSKTRRAKVAAERRMNVKHRRRWIHQQFGHAKLRGNLQMIGAVPFATEHIPTHQQRLRAGQWIVANFGERDDDGRLILHDKILHDSVEAALKAYQGGRA